MQLHPDHRRRTANSCVHRKAKKLNQSAQAVTLSHHSRTFQHQHVAYSHPSLDVHICIISPYKCICHFNTPCLTLQISKSFLIKYQIYMTTLSSLPSSVQLASLLPGVRPSDRPTVRPSNHPTIRRIFFLASDHPTNLLPGVRPSDEPSSRNLTIRPIIFTSDRPTSSNVPTFQR
jgi:hypothetical protein